MVMNQFLDSDTKKLLFGMLGFGVPLLFLLLQVFLGLGNLPLMIIMLSWFGVALFIFVGITEDDNS